MVLQRKILALALWGKEGDWILGRERKKRKERKKERRKEGRKEGKERQKKRITLNSFSTNNNRHLLPELEKYGVDSVLIFSLYSFFFLVLGLELRVYTLSLSTSPVFCGGFF
jgi:hypothetical protein